MILPLSEFPNSRSEVDQIEGVGIEGFKQLDINVTSAADVIVIRDPGALQSMTERRELGPLMAKAREAFMGDSGDRRDSAFVRSMRDNFGALLPAKLPTFWSEEVSTLFADQKLPDSSTRPKFQAGVQKIREAKDMSERGASYAVIRSRFGVFLGTAYNWVKDYRYDNDSSRQT